MGLEMGGARNGEDMNGEERDDKERTRSHAERLGESNGELGALADRRGGEQRGMQRKAGYGKRQRKPL